MKKNVNPPSIFKKIVEEVEITGHIKALKNYIWKLKIQKQHICNQIIQTLDVLVLNNVNVYILTFLFMQFKDLSSCLCGSCIKITDGLSIL